MAEKKSVQEKPEQVEEEKIKIKLPRIQGESKPFICGINGVNYSIPRGKEVEVPKSVALLIEEIERYQEEVDEAEMERRQN